MNDGMITRKELAEMNKTDIDTIKCSMCAHSNFHTIDYDRCECMCTYWCKRMNTHNYCNKWVNRWVTKSNKKAG